MKFNKKNSPLFLQLTLLCGLIGTLAWAILDVLLARYNIQLNLELNRIGFDLYILALYFTLNPGTVLGAVVGGVLFFNV